MDLMHHLVIGPRKAATVCGIRVAAYYRNSHEAMPARTGDPNIKCCAQPDYWGVLVTCQRCNSRVSPVVKSGLEIKP